MIYEVRYLVIKDGHPTMGRKFFKSSEEAESFVKKIESHDGQAMVSAYREV